MLADPVQGQALEAGTEQYAVMLAGWLAGIKQAAQQVMAERRDELEETAATRRELAGAAAKYWETRVESI